MRLLIWKAYFRKHGASSGDGLYKSLKLCQSIVDLRSTTINGISKYTKRVTRILGT